MIRSISALALVLLLAGCGVSPEQKMYVESHLPAGCTVHDLGSYGSIDMLVVVTCNGRQTTSTIGYNSHGKTHELNVALTIGN